jgi:predicted phosphodiesterase
MQKRLLYCLIPFLMAGDTTESFVQYDWPVKNTVRLILIGDTGQLPVQDNPFKINQEQRAALRKSLQSEEADAIIDLGDLYYWSGPKCKQSDLPEESGRLLDEHLYDIVGGLETPVFLVLGNHDVGPVPEFLKRAIFGDSSGQSNRAREHCYFLQAQLHEEFHFPEVSYGVDFGPIRMAAIHTSSPYRKWAPQKIDSFFAQDDGDWTLIAGHHVLKAACDKVEEDILFPWLNANNLKPDIYANGHAHFLQLGVFENILAITSGSGSKLRYDKDCIPTDTNGVTWGESKFGYSVLDVHPEKIQVRFKNVYGEELFCWQQEKGEEGKPCSL